MDEFQAGDSNWKRRDIVLSCAKAIELAKNNNFKDAIKSILLLLDGNKEKRKKNALNILTNFLKSYDEYADKSVLDFSLFISPHLKNYDVNLSAVTKGAPYTFYSNHSYKELVTSINLGETKTLFRTIHKSKGDEFDNVMLVLKKDSDLDFLLSPNLDGTEIHRVFYVAASRAKKRLFITIPSLENNDREKLQNLNLQISDLHSDNKHL